MEKEQLDSFLLKDIYNVSKIDSSSLFEVYIGFHKNGEKLIIKKSSDKFHLKKILEKEFYILKELKMDFVPKPLSFLEGTENYLILSYIPGNNLKYLKKNKGFNWPEIRNIFLMSLNIINELHKMNIIHGDIKPENIIYENKLIYFIDFGASIKEGKEETIVQFTPSNIIQNNCINYKKNKNFDIYCLFRVLRYLLLGSSDDINLLKEPLRSFLTKGLQSGYFKVEEVLDQWDFLKL